jgi:hypothetical protein
MIVGPHKGIFFVATALMCSASLYGAELSAPSSNPLARIFTGEPNRLTLPPDFPDAALSLDQDESCAHQGADHEFSGAAALQTASTSGGSVPSGNPTRAGLGSASGRRFGSSTGRAREGGAGQRWRDCAVPLSSARVLLQSIENFHFSPI